MEWVQVFIQFISNVGFPIAAFCAMWLLNLKTEEAIKELSKTVALNTEAINDLKEKIRNKE